MDVVCTIWGLFLGIYIAKKYYKTTNQKIAESDADPYNSVKSDKWNKEHNNSN